MSKSWYEIKDKGELAEVLIYDEIGMWGITAKDFVKDLKGLGDVKQMSVRINSPGGSVFDGNAIYNAIKNHKARVTVHIDSIALSMGSVIAMAGDHIEMAENALMMIHDPSGGAWGTADNLRKHADMLDKAKATLISSYVSKTGIEAESISEMMDEETWFTSSEALEQGFVDEVTGAMEMTANFDLSKFNNVPEALQKNEEIKTTTGVVNTLIQNAVKAACKDFKTPSAVADKQLKGEAMKDEKGATVDTVEKDKIANEAVKAAFEVEDQRRTAINDVFALHGDKYIALEAQCLENRNIDVNAAREKLLAEIGKEQGSVAGDTRIETIADARDKFHVAASEALHIRSGGKSDDKANPYRSFTLLDVARECLKIASIDTKGWDKMRVVGAAFTHTGSDFPLLLENSLGKALQTAYGNFPETWSSIADTSSVPDFKQNSRIRLGSFNSLDLIPEGDEYQSGTFSEERETIQAATKGKMISLTRQMIINDDLGGFMRIAQMMGRAAARTVGNDVYAIFSANADMSDGTALFHADHNNLAGSGAAPTVITVGAGRTAMRKQQDLDGNDYLDIRPSVILSGVELEDVINVLMSSETDPSQANSRKPNAIRGMAEVVTDPRLGTTEWYLLAAPSLAPTIEVAFLDGNQTPYLESMNGFTIDGTRWKVRLDYGVAAVDFRGAYKNAGA